jgi:DNA-binding transcriptional ArsR family regulator
MDKVFKALADANRRKLLDVLFKKNGRTLGELADYLDMSRQAASKHLKILEEADLVVVKWNGREKLHFLNPIPIHEIYSRWVSKYEEHRLLALEDLKLNLTSTKHRR